MTPVDDLHVHQWVAVVNQEKPEAPALDIPWLMGPPRSKPVAYDGAPMKIIAISLPFIAVYNLFTKKMQTIDMRITDVKLLHRRYVEVALASMAANGEMKAPGLPAFLETAPKKPKPRTRDEDILRQWTCPRCGYRLVERRVGNGLWQKFCEDCGFGGEGVNP